LNVLPEKPLFRVFSPTWPSSHREEAAQNVTGTTSRRLELAIPAAFRGSRALEAVGLETEVRASRRRLPTDH
jgi:hypothetical protein